MANKLDFGKIEAESFYITKNKEEGTQTAQTNNNIVWEKVTAPAIEKNNKRATFAMPQSLYDRLSDYSKELDLSINELVRRVLDTYLKMEGK